MKAITIWQPWSSLLACGAKGFETRSWATSYRGPIAIHAAALSIPRVLKKTFPMSEWAYHPDHDAKEQFMAVLTKAFSDYTPIEDIMGFLDELPTGAVVATANLIGCQKIIAPFGERPPCFGNTPFIRLENGDTYDPDDMELMVGDWTPGRYAWEFSDMKAIAPTPIPAKGKQGLWEWDGGGLDV